MRRARLLVRGDDGEGASMIPAPLSLQHARNFEDICDTLCVFHILGWGLCKLGKHASAMRGSESLRGCAFFSSFLQLVDHIC